MVRPDAPMSPGARKVHGISDEELATAPTFASLAPTIERLLQGTVVAGHNVHFDLKYLTPALARVGVELAPTGVMDTLQLARRVFAFRKNSLSAVGEELGVVTIPQHRALGDAIAGREVLCRMIDVLDASWSVSVQELLDLVDLLEPGSPFRMSQQELLRDAYRERRTVWIEYPSGHDDKYDFQTRELGIWKMRLPRVQGWCYLRGGERIFRVDRMKQVGPGEREYEIPDFEDRI